MSKKEQYAIMVDLTKILYIQYNNYIISFLHWSIQLSIYCSYKKKVWSYNANLTINISTTASKIIQPNKKKQKHTTKTSTNRRSVYTGSLSIK